MVTYGPPFGMRDLEGFPNSHFLKIVKNRPKGAETTTQFRGKRTSLVTCAKKMVQQGHASIIAHANERLWPMNSAPEIPWPWLPGKTLIRMPNPVPFSPEFAMKEGYAFQVTLTYCWKDLKGEGGALARVGDMHLAGEDGAKWITPFLPNLPKMIPILKDISEESCEEQGEIRAQSRNAAQGRGQGLQ